MVEKVSFKNIRDKKLVGDFYKGSLDSCIIMCHGFTGDRHENGMFDKVAQGLNKRGYNVLVFDFSGSGESDDDGLSVGKQVEDLNSAIDYIAKKGINKIGLYGHSLGGLVILRTKNSNIETAILTAPVTNKKENYKEYRFNEVQLKELKEKGYASEIKNKEGLFRTKIMINWAAKVARAK